MKTVTLIAGLSLSVISGYFSIIGLSQLFAGALVVMIMAGILEGAKLSIVALLRIHKIKKHIQVYLITAVVALCGIGGMGAFGYLSGAFEEITTQITQAEEMATRRAEIAKEREAIGETIADIRQDIAVLRRALSDNTIQYADTAGRIITTTSSANRRAYLEQIDLANADIKQMQTARDNLLFEIPDNNPGSDHGAMVFVARALNIGIDQVASIIIIVIILLLDPLALTMISVSLSVTAHDETFHKTVTRRHRQGYSLREIAAETGKSHMAVSRSLRKGRK